MSILTNVYNVEETSGASGSELTTHLTKFFSFDIDSITKENNNRSLILWNFGDPNDDSSNPNEIVSHNITNSIVKHIYKYPRTYKINSITTINGIIFHNEQTLTISPN